MEKPALYITIALDNKDTMLGLANEWSTSMLTAFFVKKVI